MKATIQSSLAFIRYTIMELFYKKVFWVLLGILVLVLLLLILLLDQSKISELATFHSTGELFNKEALAELVSFFVSRPIYHTILFFMLFMGASMFPSLIEKGSAELLLTTPLSRIGIFLSRIAGIYIIVFGISLVFYTMLWLLTLIYTGISLPSLFSAAIYLSLVFLIYYSITVITGLLSKNSMVSLIITFFMILIFGLILHVLHNEIGEMLLDTVWEPIVAGLYWIFPKTSILMDIHADVIKYNFLPIPQIAEFFSSIGFGIVLFALAGYRFYRLEY